MWLHVIQGGGVADLMLIWQPIHFAQFAATTKHEFESTRLHLCSHFCSQSV